MEKGGPIARARKGFQQFVREFDDTFARHGGEFEYLQDWLYAWLQAGNGIEWTGRSYETYLRTCLDIADAAFRGQINYDYRGSAKENYRDARPRRIEAIHNPDNSDEAYYADRATYEQLATELEYDSLRELTQ